MSRIAALLVLLASPVLPVRAQEVPVSSAPSLSGAERWACFYGRNMSVETWNSLDLAIVDPDGFRVPYSSGAIRALSASAPVRVAYVSAGEADERRFFWREVRGKEYVVEPNPEWPGAHRVDVRDKAWRALLTDTVVPQALAAGYQGVMLDTVDVAAYFESSAPVRFAGSVDAMGDFILDLRRRYPGTVLLVNNGLFLLERLGRAIDGVLVEDVYTRCLPASKRCEATPEELTREKEEVLTAFRAATGRPVFVLVYAGLSERKSRLVKRAVRRARKMGFLPYIASPSLERLGEVAPER